MNHAVHPKQSFSALVYMWSALSLSLAKFRSNGNYIVRQHSEHMSGRLCRRRRLPVCLLFMQNENKRKIINKYLLLLNEREREGAGERERERACVLSQGRLRV